jgi:anaerobic ribonucleoside-triphosphate reductase activating protein
VQIVVAQTVPKTTAEGFGVRFALWVQGCSLRCPQCCNPEMFSVDKGGERLEVDDVISTVLSTTEIEGVSFLGGEPFEQALALSRIAKEVRQSRLSVMVFSGYTLTELKAKAANGDQAVAALLEHTDVLVDGRFEASQLDNQRRWIGSTNQQVHHLTERYRSDDAQLREANTVDIRFEKGRITVNGWPALAKGFGRL